VFQRDRNRRLARASAVAAGAALLAALAASAQEPAAPPPNPTIIAPASPLPVLKLEDAESAARVHQPQLLEVRASAEAADARVGEARAPLLPQVTGTLAYQRTTGNYVPRAGAIPSTTTSGASSSSTWTTYNGFSDSVVANQLIWDFNQTLGRYGAAKDLSQSAVYNEKAQELLIILNVRSAFFSARANKALAAVARETVANDQKHLEQIQGFVEAGTRSQVDLAQARTDLANAQLALVTDDNNYELAKQQLNLAMGVIASTDFDVADQSLPPVPGETTTELGPLIDEALKARPEMASFNQQVAAQEATISSTRGAYGPAISATAGFTQGGEALDNLAWNAYVGVNLSWNLFQGGLTNATVREAQANLRNLAAQSEAQRQQIAADVNSARLAVRAGIASLEAAKVVVMNAKELLRLAEGQYENGLGSIIQLSDAQVAASSAQAQQIQAEFNLAAARAQLLKALGRPQ